MKSLIFDGVEQEQEVICLYFLKPKPIDIALLFKQFLDDLGARFLVSDLPLTSRKVAILGRGGKKFSATARFASEFESAFPTVIDREVTVQLAHFQDSRNLGMADLRFSRATSGSPFGPEAQVFVGVVGATVGVVDWSSLEHYWASLADQSGCDWADFGQPSANRTVGNCVVGVADGLVVSTLACESVFGATGVDPREAFRSYPVGESRVALFRDPAHGQDDSAWSDTVALLAGYLVKQTFPSEDGAGEE
jgi:hypothetical protein